jgi:hypothetical protein
VLAQRPAGVAGRVDPAFLQLGHQLLDDVVQAVRVK